MPKAYPPEFKQGAVALARRGDRSVREIAQELGIAESCLRRWVRQGQLDVGERSDGVSSDEREELVELRRRVRRLEQEKDILRKAAAFFAQQEIR